MRALFYTVVARIRDFLRPGAGEADFEQELEAHLAMAEADKVRRGMSPEQARREARRDLGGAAQLREAARAARGLPWLETFIGAIVGCALALRLHSSLPIAEAGGLSIPGIVPASAALMIAVGLLTVAGPARRALRIDPIEALRV